MSQTLPSLIRCLALFVASLPLAMSASDGVNVHLRTPDWSIVVDPATLQLDAALPSGPVVRLSGPQDLGPIDGLEQNGSLVTWRYSRRGLTVTMRASGSELAVELSSDRPGAFTWPLVEPTPSVRAYILPYQAGRYVPKGDAEWVEYLAGTTFTTLEQLSMPFWALDCGAVTVTYLVTNPFNNEIGFSSDGGELALRLTHSFPRNRERREIGIRIRLGVGSPVEPARQYRRWLEEKGEIVSLAEKIRRVPRVERLLGAPHVYLWGTPLSRHDVADWSRLCKALVGAGRADDASPGKRIWTLLDEGAREAIAQAAERRRPHEYEKARIARSLGALLERRDFFDAPSWNDIPDEAGRARAQTMDSLSDGEVLSVNSRLLGAAFPGVFTAVESWGGGVSTRMLQRLRDLGLARLCLTLSDLKSADARPQVARLADELGYLLGPYDSYHSIHHPDEPETWETAQFDLALYRTGAIERADGTRIPGFQKKGFKLSPIAARPYVERRVRTLMDAVRFTSWFIDCDAYGEVYDDYSPLHPATQEDDMRARLDRMAWVSDTFEVVVGSEGGSSYAAGVIHFAHGLMTPAFGWGDPELADRESKYWLGGYWPPEGPAVFMKAVPLHPRYERLHFDPRFRLPLYQAALGDCVIVTHQWGRGSLKFADHVETTSLIELLYDVPPLYHLNLDELDKHADRIKRHYDFFAPLHRELALLPLTEFDWLSGDRLVQRTVFGDTVELVANFSAVTFDEPGLTVPPRTILARWRDTGVSRSFTP